MGRCRCSSTVCPQTKPDPNPVGGLLRATASRCAGLAPLALRFGSIPRAARPPPALLLEDHHRASGGPTRSITRWDAHLDLVPRLPAKWWGRSGTSSPVFSVAYALSSMPGRHPLQAGPRWWAGRRGRAKPSSQAPPRTTWRNRTRHHPLTPSTSGRRAYAAITRAWEVMPRNCETFLLKGTCPSRVVFSAAPGVQRLA